MKESFDAINSTPTVSYIGINYVYEIANSTGFCYLNRTLLNTIVINAVVK